MPETVAAGETAADGDYAALEALQKAVPPAPPREMGAEEFSTWLDGQRQQGSAAALVFYAAYPAGARRWKWCWRS
ncbi:MAG: hypothetical protein H7343_03625 [Undibacterium sp.]|nr:hypothetical protein [Opitutaceae bacterium]